MKERPILFSAPMVRAILDGSKTQTRRVVKLPVEYSSRWSGGWHIVGKAATIAVEMFNRLRGKPLGTDPTLCPYGQPGDRLWVRETWAIASKATDLVKVYYAASEHQSYTEFHEYFPVACAGEMYPTWPKYRPSIHMPRWASRILLEIVSVRVERLQDISEADARAEGIEKTKAGFWSLYGQRKVDGTYSPRASYQALWESINGAGSWEANHWVWVVEFKRVPA